MRTRLSLAKAARMRDARLSEMSQTQTKILQLVDVATIAVTARGRGPAGVLGKTLAVSVTRNIRPEVHCPTRGLGATA